MPNSFCVGIVLEITTDESDRPLFTIQQVGTGELEELDGVRESGVTADRLICTEKPYVGLASYEDIKVPDATKPPDDKDGILGISPSYLTTGHLLKLLEFVIEFAVESESFEEKDRHMLAEQLLVVLTILIMHHNCAVSRSQEPLDIAGQKRTTQQTFTVHIKSILDMVRPMGAWLRPIPSDDCLPERGMAATVHKQV